MSDLSLYSGLQTVFPKEKEISERERLLSAVDPLLSWYEAHRRDLPWRKDRDPYRIWVSEIMLQQTRVEAVKPYFARFMEHFPTPDVLAFAPEEELLKCWEGLGYYSRARNLQKAAKAIAAEHGGRFPETFEEILALPGIGSYTAGAIASIAFRLPVPAVDGNVLRVISRVLASRDDILKAGTKKRMEGLLREILETRSSVDPGEFNQALIETGAIVCVPNGEPLCGQCPFYTVCLSRERELTGEIPVKTPKKKRKTEEKTVLLLEYQDKIAIRKRSAQGLLASLYEFYSLPGALSADEVKERLQITEEPERLTDAKHIFSHVEWHMNGYFVELSKRPLTLSEDVIFVSRKELRATYPIPSAFSAYKKILDERLEVKK